MKRQQAIETIFNAISPFDITISTTGLICREVFTSFDADRNIYVPGSMGLASSIGLAIALCVPNKIVITIDGDASLLMNLGSMVTIGHMRPKNFLHIVLDNGAYGSCSEEKSMSDSANLEKIAKSVGYQYVIVVNCKKDLSQAILSFKNGPGFILTKIELGGRRDFARPLNLEEIKWRFLQFLQKNNNIRKI